MDENDEQTERFREHQERFEHRPDDCWLLPLDADALWDACDRR
jgi:hypothetical protein